MQLDKEAGLVNVGNGLCRDAVSGQKHPEGGRKTVHMSASTHGPGGGFAVPMGLRHWG